MPELTIKYIIYHGCSLKAQRLNLILQLTTINIPIELPFFLKSELINSIDRKIIKNNQVKALANRFRENSVFTDTAQFYLLV